VSDVQVCKYNPAEIRAALPASRRDEFEVAFLTALAKAGQTFSLDELHKVLEAGANALAPATSPHSADPPSPC
jgi:hypothetical protein